MTILCEVDQATVAGIAPGLGGAIRVTASLPEAAIAVAEDEAEDLVVIGHDAPLDQVLDFTANVRNERPSVSVVLLRNHYDPQGVTAALKAGVREVVQANDSALLVNALRRAVAVPATSQSSPDGEVLPESKQVDDAAALVEQPRASGKIVTVFAPKGGSGKTTISTNLAVALSEIAPPVCLVDLDLQFGDVAISLSLAPTRTIADAVKMEVEGDEDDALAMLTTEYRPGLNCVLAPVEPGDAEPIRADLVADLLALLRTRYAYVVVDTPAQLSPIVLAALDASDHHVLLTNPEVPSLKNLRLTLDMLDLLHYPRERRSIVFNRADAAAGLSAAEVEEALKAPIAARVPASRDVPASINRGVPIVQARKDHPVSVAITRFAAEVIAPVPAPAARHATRRFFRRRTQ